MCGGGCAGLDCALRGWSSRRTRERVGLSVCIADGGVWGFGKHLGLAGCGTRGFVCMQAVFDVDMVNRRTAAFWQAYSVFTHRDRAEVGWLSCNTGRTSRARAPEQIDTGSENIIL